jgi:DNA-binding NtrC family response regulator
MRPTALLVDDDPTTLVALPDTLKCRLPLLRVETTTSVVDALARLEGRPYSVLLTDLRMPRMDGLSFLHEVKQRHADTPVVIMSGTHDLAVVMQAFEAGAFDFLPKPLDRDDLSTTIQLALCTFGLQRDLQASQQRLRRYAERLRRFQTEPLVDLHVDLQQLASAVLEEATLVRSRSASRVAQSRAMIQRQEKRVQETANLLRSVRDVAHRRSQARAVFHRLTG